MTNIESNGAVTIPPTDRKSTRLNSSHGYISYAVFCLKKKKKLHEGIQSLTPTYSLTLVVLLYDFPSQDARVGRLTPSSVDGVRTAAVTRWCVSHASFP